MRLSLREIWPPYLRKFGFSRLDPRRGPEPFWGPKTPISLHPHTGRTREFFPCVLLQQKGDFLIENSLFQQEGKWGFGSETTFSRKSGFGLCLSAGVEKARSAPHSKEQHRHCPLHPDFPHHSLRQCPAAIFENSPSGGVLWLLSKVSNKACEILQTFKLEDLIFLLACSVHFVRRRFGRLLWDSVEIAQNHQRTKCAEHTSKKIRSSKRLELYILLTIRYSAAFLALDLGCSFFAYSWKLPACNGAVLLTVVFWISSAERCDGLRFPRPQQSDPSNPVSGAPLAGQS